MKVLITELIWESGIKEMERMGVTVDYDIELGRNRDRLLSIISEYDAIIVRNITKVDTELLEKGEKLKVIGRLGVGLDNIDLNKACEKNITVVAAKHANATSVAEYVMAAMLDASRKISDATKNVREGGWDRKLFTGVELSGKTLGLFGLGEISHRVAKRAKAFEMKLVGYDPFVTSYDFIIAETGVEKALSFDDLLAKSDYISIHVPLTKETENVFNRVTFSLMKSNSYIINTSRGGIINEADLFKALENKEIAGAYLDVLEKEPVQFSSLLLRLNSIKITPHVAGLTQESQERISLLVAQEVMKVMKGNRSLYAV